jgi:hypothetical protein
MLTTAEMPATASMAARAGGTPISLRMPAKKGSSVTEGKQSTARKEGLQGRQQQQKPGNSRVDISNKNKNKDHRRLQQPRRLHVLVKEGNLVTTSATSVTPATIVTNATTVTQNNNKDAIQGGQQQLMILWRFTTNL